MIAPGLDEHAIKVLADQIVAAASAPFEVGDHQFFVGASVGIVTVPPDGGPLLDALRLADHAMYEAKRLGGSRWQFSRCPSELVPEVGLEPTRPFGQRILSPSRLPFRHSGE